MWHFCTKWGQLGPCFGHIMFFGSKEVRWNLVLVMSRILDQKKSVGTWYWLHHIFWIEGGQLGPCFGHIMSLDQRRSLGQGPYVSHAALKEVIWGSVLVIQMLTDYTPAAKIRRPVHIWDQNLKNSSMKANNAIKDFTVCLPIAQHFLRHYHTAQ